MQTAKGAAATVKEKVSNAAATMEEKMGKTKAATQGQMDKVKAHDEAEKQMATEKKETRMAQAEEKKQQKVADHAASAGHAKHQETAKEQHPVSHGLHPTGTSTKSHEETPVIPRARDEPVKTGGVVPP